MRRMDCSHSEEELMDSSKVTVAEELEAEETQAAKRRKVAEKTVVRVKIEAGNEGKQRSEGPPSDCWSWRKYGQKPIKGSPYPRGYYRCSTSKGCSAKKQVERCKTDATMLIITYTSSHNHPDPDFPSTNVSISKQTKESKSNSTVDQPTTPEKEQEEKEKEEKGQKQVMEEEEEAEKDGFHYCQSPFNYSQDMITSHHQHDNYPLLEKAAYDTPSILLYEEEPLCYPPSLMSFSGTKSEENDFYDELEELPSSSSSTSYFFRSNFFDERILLI